jgi:8-amino-7-oxononanoate synthase
MTVQERCKDFSAQIDSLKANNRFFYLREFDPAAEPHVMRNGRKAIMLGSNNYLGLTSHPKVVKATVDAIKKYGTGACSSRLLTGTTSLHTRLEQALARFKGTEDAVVFSTGFMTMSGTIAALTAEGDAVFSDEFNHAGIIDGCRLSRASTEKYRHNDMAHLEELLAGCKTDGTKLIVTDGVFSMRGTVANLPAIRRLADAYGAAVMVDDAHGTGVMGAKGRGTPEHFGLEGKIEIVCGTFSKSLATIGGFTGSSREIVNYLKLNARPFIFTASPPPSIMATVLACLEVLEEEPALLQRLHANARFLKERLRETGFRLEETITPIIPVLIGEDDRTFMMAGMLEEEGVIVNPVVAPAVPKGKSLIRISVMATLTTRDLESAAVKLEKVGKKLGIV